MNALASIVAVVLTFVLVGCVDVQYGPRLPVDFVSEDEAMLGAWFVIDRGQMGGTCVIEEIAIPVEDGLIDPASTLTYLVGSDEAPDDPETEKRVHETAYRITIRPNEESASRKVLYGYVIPIDDVKYLGVHVGMGELAKSMGPFLAVPTFMLMKYQLDDEHLQLWMPHAVAFCVPGTGWENAMDGSSGVWITDTSEAEAAASIKKMGGLTLAPTIEKLIAYYEEHATEEGFFFADGFAFRRVPIEHAGG